MFTIGLLIWLCKDNVLVQLDSHWGVNQQCEQVDLKIWKSNLSSCHASLILGGQSSDLPPRGKSENLNFLLVLRGHHHRSFRIYYTKDLIMDLMMMLAHIEETLPSTLHLPVSSEDTLHFYWYLCMHVLITNKQFLLLTDVSIQDQSQLSIYKLFTLDIPHGNFTAHYDVNTPYPRITQDETMAVEISQHQFCIVKKQMDSFATFLHHSNHSQTHHLAFQLCMPRIQLVSLTDVHYGLEKAQMSVCLLSLHQMFGS